MKNIIKILFSSLLVMLFITSCRDDADKDWMSAGASFKLYDTTLGGNELYPTMKDNPLKFVWDDTTGAAKNYKVVISSSTDFASSVQLGTSTTNSFDTTVGAFNLALLQAGFNPFASNKVYLRVVNGDNKYSNTITFVVTPYPVTGPVITAPTAGTSLLLDSTNQSATAATITWSDYTSYGVDVVYSIDVALSGTTSFVNLGSVTNTKSLVVTNKELNTAVVNTGATINASNNIDIKVTAKTTSTGGTLTYVSNIVTFKVTPYQVDYPSFYLVGGGTAVGWSASTSQMLYKHDNVSEIYTYLDQNGPFRFLGQQDWNPINYSLNTTGIRDAYKYFKTWSSNLTTATGDDENIKFTDASGMYHIAINADFGVKSITVTPSGIQSYDIPNLYLVGSINGWDASNAIPFSTALGGGKFETYTQLPNGAEFKFIGQQSWGALDWGNINGTANTGYLGPKDHNGNVKFDGGDAWFKIYVDLKLGIYTITPL